MFDERPTPLARCRRLRRAAQGPGDAQHSAHQRHLLAAVLAAGCGELPKGLEMAVQLMLPGELALVSLRAPAGASTAHTSSSGGNSSSGGGGGGSNGGAGSGGPAACSVAYGYATCDHAPPAGIGPGDEVDFEVELVGFDKEGHWQVRCGVCARIGLGGAG